MSKEKTVENLITIVGASQSGKTTLAAGLAKTSSEDFTVGFVGNVTRDYLQPRIAGIASGHWPEATSDENRDIRLNLNTPGGRSALISFKEYMGEKIHDAAYLEKIVGKPHGALILLSPGMDVLRNPIEREKLIGNLKKIIDYLKKNKCVATAFVVTACDRLKTDLKDFSQTFEDYAAEITNYLNTSGMVWERFDVTITGKLQDQGQPSIAVGDDNTSRKPFVWIMDRVAGKKRMVAAMHTGRVASLLGALAVLAFGIVRGVQYHSDKKMLENDENVFRAIEREISDANKESELKKKTDELDALIISNSVRKCHFDSLGKRQAKDVEDWKRLYDQYRADYFNVSMTVRSNNRKSRGSEEECQDFDNALESFNPNDKDLKTPLVSRWEKLRPQIRKDYDVNSDTKKGNGLQEEIDKMAANAATEASPDNLKTLRKEIDEWKPLTTDGATQKTNILERLQKDSPDWQIAFSDRICTEASNDVVRKIRGLAPDAQGSDADAVCKVMEEAFGFAEKHQKATPEILAEATKRINGERSKFLDKFQASFVKKWDLNARTPPVIRDYDKDYIIEALEVTDPASPKEKVSVAFLKELEGKRQEAEEEWKNKQKRICEEFIAKVKGMSAVDLYYAYRKWYENNDKNPSVSIVNQEVEKAVSAFFEGYMSEFIKTFYENGSAFNSDAGRKHARDQFTSFQQLCLALNNDLNNDCCGLEGSWCVEFARDCKKLGNIDKGMEKAFLRDFCITGLSVQLHIDDSRYRGHQRVVTIVQRLSTCAGDKPDETIASGRFYDEQFHAIGPKGIRISMNPWSRLYIRIDGKVINDFQPDDEISEWFILSPYDKNFTAKGCYEWNFRGSSGVCVIDTYSCSVRISGKFEGTDIFMLYGKYHR